MNAVDQQMSDDTAIERRAKKGKNYEFMRAMAIATPALSAVSAAKDLGAFKKAPPDKNAALKRRVENNQFETDQVTA